MTRTGSSTPSVHRSELRICLNFLARYGTRIGAMAPGLEAELAQAVRMLNQTFAALGQFEHMRPDCYRCWVVERYADGFVEIPCPPPIAAYAVVARSLKEAISACPNASKGAWVGDAQTKEQVADDPDFWNGLEPNEPVEWDGPVAGKWAGGL